MLDRLKDAVTEKFLDILWGISAFTCLVAYDRGVLTNVPVGFKYGLTILGTAVLGYLTTFLGLWGYLTTRSSMLDSALEDASNMSRFVDTLSQPAKWVNITLATTAVYFAAKLWIPNLPISYSLALQTMSIASLVACVFSILRNAHLLKMYFIAAIGAVRLHELMKDEFMENIMARIEEAIEEDEKEEKSKNDNETIH